MSIGVDHAPVAARYLAEVDDPGLDRLVLAGRYTLPDRSGLDDVPPLRAGRPVTAAGGYQPGPFAGPRPGGPHGGATLPDEPARRVAAWHEVCVPFAVPPTAAAVPLSARVPTPA